MSSRVEEWVPVPEFLKVNAGKVDRNLIYRLISEGGVPCVRLGSKKLLIPSNLFDLLAEKAQDRG